MKNFFVLTRHFDGIVSYQIVRDFDDEASARAYAEKCNQIRASIYAKPHRAQHLHDFVVAIRNGGCYVEI